MCLRVYVSEHEPTSRNMMATIGLHKLYALVLVDLDDWLEFFEYDTDSHKFRWTCT